MASRSKGYGLILPLLIMVYIQCVAALTGHVHVYYTMGSRRTTVHSGLFGWSRRTVWRYFMVQKEQCEHGWRADSKGWCGIPICYTPCYNGGTCINPDKCRCPPSHRGDNCAQLLCSHQYPCYPGFCQQYTNDCTCTEGFSGAHCLNFTATNLPSLSACDITLAKIRRTDNKQQFYYSMPCSPGSSKDIIWCNQELFNYAKFTMDSFYQQIPNLPPKPAYVTDGEFGIVDSKMHVLHSKVKRNGVPGRFVALDTEYHCTNGTTDQTPAKDLAYCTIIEDNYKINIEHGDSFTVTYYTKSGGFRKLYDIDHNRYYKTEVYHGQTANKQVEFKFDFIAPVHCSETQLRCNDSDAPIRITKDITKDPITPRWSGWSDKLSGLSYYYVEIFRLEPDIHGDLTESNPLKPIHSYTTNNTNTPSFETYTPDGPGMYSILLQTSDKANNSKIARRLFLYDNVSSITLTKPGMTNNSADKAHMTIGDGGMHVVSAIPETGYMWQTSTNGSSYCRIVLNWENHFVNKLYEDGKLLNKVLPYPIQFQDLADDGILRSDKFVALDDTDGDRTVNAIPNQHGIVKFEVYKVYSDDKKVPTGNWTNHPLTEHFESDEYLAEGRLLRLWVRATDIMNNTVADFTEVHIDNSPPIVNFPDDALKMNIENGTYTYTSRIRFTASDRGSGVHKIGYKLVVENSTDIKKMGYVPGNRNNETNACTTNSACICVLDDCFLITQTVDIDNCWFIVPKEDLNKSAIIMITIYNQALLTKEFTVNVSMLRHLKGLEEYSGPTNIHVEKKLSNGVRLAWDLPKNASCYGRVDIDIILYSSDGTLSVHRIYNEETSYDLIGLEPDKDYRIALSLGYQGTSLGALPYTFKTAPRDNYLAGGAIAAIVISIVVIIGILVAIFVVLLRRGHMQPVRRGMHAVSVRYRQSRAGGHAKHNAYDNKAYARNKQTESLYMYGEMDFSDAKSWHMSRSDVVFESLLKSGNFANIYKASLNSSGRGKNSPVVAKTLKDGFTEADEFLMRAKINFTALEVGQHENILQFVGAAVDASEIGPFIVYEYCENGTMKDYLVGERHNVTVTLQENLFRFGLGIARGMEYLAEKKIVHRRLAARNILLDSSLVVKISGFGPQPAETNNDDDGKPNKRERIPIKWAAPECFKTTVDGTEKSDMWSYGVVLWEIFSLGEVPYENIKGRELPDRIKRGERLPKPEQCDDKWYSVMERAWNISPKKRPTFKDIRNELDELFVAAPTDDYYYYRR